MKPIILAVCAMMCYAVANVIYESRLTKINNVAVLCGWYAVMLPLALAVLGTMKLSGQSIKMPGREDVFAVVLTAIIWLVADAFFTGAYTAGGTVMVVTSITIMFPAFAAVIRYYSTGHTVNLYQVGGYLLAVGAVFLIQKGSQVPQLP